MIDFAPYLIAASALILFTLGALHLLYTFRGNLLHPRDPALIARMQEVSPVISRQTTMWKAWVGFNASHSYGALLFGLIYGYLALARPAVLLGSGFLIAVGLIALLGYCFLGKRYWFSVPFRAIVVATVLYVLALVAPAVITKATFT